MAATNYTYDVTDAAMTTDNDTSHHEWYCDRQPPPNDALETAILLVMLGIFSVVGVTGNTLVLYVYSKKRDKQVSSCLLNINRALIRRFLCSS